MYPIAIECDVDEWIANVSTNFNQSFVSPDGVVWYDLHSNNTVLYKGFASALVYYNLSNAHVCLKAFTANILDTVITSDNLTFKALENHSIAINLAGADIELIDMSRDGTITTFGTCKESLVKFYENFNFDWIISII